MQVQKEMQYSRELAEAQSEAAAAATWLESIDLSPGAKTNAVGRTRQEVSKHLDLRKLIVS